MPLFNYIAIDKAKLRDDDLCVGIQRQGVWHFAPLFILNSHEIVNHPDAPAIAYCPLAGLSVVIDGRTYISGLLRWDTFVLYDPDSDSLILPFDQKSLDGEQIRLQPLELLTFAGVRHKFPDAGSCRPLRITEIALSTEIIPATGSWGSVTPSRACAASTMPTSRRSTPRNRSSSSARRHR